MLNDKLHKTLHILTLLSQALLLSSLFGGAPGVAGDDSEDSVYKAVAYYPNWAIYPGSDVHPDQIPYNSLTHLIYAFAMPRGDGKILLSDPYADVQDHYVNVPASEVSTMTKDVPDEYKDVNGVISQLYYLKEKNKNLKVMLSVGGWNYSNKGKFGSPFSNLTRNAEARQTFARSAVDLMNAYKFDGLDIDWEYPSDETERQNFVELCNLVREEFDKKSMDGGNRYLLSVATPSSTKKLENFDLKGMSNVGVDFFNFMAFDYSNPNTSDHVQYSANWKSTSKTTKDNLSKGNTTGPLQIHTDQVNPKKVVVGMATYAQVFSKNGTKLTMGSSWTPGAANTTDCKNLPDSGKGVNYDDQAIAAYYENDTAVYVYDTTESLKAKAKLIKDQKLGGAMFWDLTKDRDMPDARADKGSLIGAFVETVGNKSLETQDNNRKYTVVSVTSPGLEESSKPTLDPVMSSTPSDAEATPDPTTTEASSDSTEDEPSSDSTTTNTDTSDDTS